MPPTRAMVLAALTLLAACGDRREADRYVGTAACAVCHTVQAEAWTGSHHDLAMQPASDSTVLADFDDTTFDYAGITTIFSHRNGEFVVRTDGPEGSLQDYVVRYTFGVYPLQQYLLELPGGRLQAFTVAWDTRPAAEGGQRWFHLYPDDAVTADDELHWTRLNQNWNRGCADCHSTNLQQGYDAETKTYATTWSDIDVGCEACHGPGSEHVSWAERNEPYQPGATGLTMLRASSSGWEFHPGESIAQPAASPDRTEVETCAPCHSRRFQMNENHLPGDPLLDSYQPAALDEELYFPDGQILEEVYVYGSFLQSRMYHRGVSCSDCHEPHSLELLAPGNALCANCHLPAVYDGPEHHRHAPESKGSQCVACHMPERTYMVVDDRSDHGMRIPRPDLSLELGTPNSCTQCHTDRTDAWATQVLIAWYGPKETPTPHFAELLYGARLGAPRALDALAALAGQDTISAIIRATALDQLAQFPSQPALQAIIRAIDDGDPLVRYHALGALSMLPPGERWQLAEHRLRDSVLSVRSQAGRVLAGTPAEQLSAEQQAVLDQAIEDYLAIQAFDADHPASHVNIGLVEAARGRIDVAVEAYQEAIAMDPTWVPAYVNLADLYRSLGRDPEAEVVLREALGSVRQGAAIRYSLGLLLARSQRMDEALAELRRAHEEAPEQPRFAYVYGVALNGAGSSEDAVAVFEEALVSNPMDQELLYALATVYRDLGDAANGMPVALRLRELSPTPERIDPLIAEFAALSRPGSPPPSN